jgi:hypothetical protein
MPTYEVTGTLTPDATGDYTGSPIRRADAAFEIIYDFERLTGGWCLQPVGWIAGQPYWFGGPNLVGEYSPQGGADGTATVVDVTRLSVSGAVACATADTGPVAGTFNGQSYWTWAVGGTSYYLWYVLGGGFPPTIYWRISTDLSWDGNGWQRSGAFIDYLGDYAPQGTAEGTATVAEYVPPVATSVEVVMGAQGKVVIDGATEVSIGGNVVFPA